MFHHSALGLRVGLTKEKLDALEKYGESALFDAVEKLLLRYAEEYLARGGAGSETVEALKKHYSEEQLVELDVILAIVNLVNHFISTFGIEIEKDNISPGELKVLRQRMRRT